MCSYNKDICRTCMDENTNLTDIFSSTSTISSISTAIMECAPILISETDTLSHQICAYCLDKLEVAYNFRILCIETDQTLRNNVSGTIVKEENDEKSRITPITKTEILLDDCEIKTEKSEHSYTESLSDNDRISDNEREDVIDLKELNVEKLAKQQPEINLKRDQSVATKNVLRQKDDEYFQCEQCPKKYKFMKGFRKHLNSHTNLLFNCDSPEEITPPRKKHVKKRAKRQPKTKLKFGQSKPSKKVLKRKSDGYFHCEQCPKKYKEVYAFRRHFVSHTNFRYNCEKCGKKYWNKYYFKSHMEIVHATEPTCSCEFCGKTFRALKCLRKHHRVHSEIRPFKCNVCEKAFKREEVLRKHSLVHKDERPHVCGECGRSFKRKDHLRVHDQLHTGKRFKCTSCGQAFQTRQSMNNHLLKSCPQLT